MAAEAALVEHDRRSNSAVLASAGACDDRHLLEGPSPVDGAGGAVFPDLELVLREGQAVD